MDALRLALAVLLCAWMATTAIGAETIHFREGGGTGYTDVTFDDTWIFYDPADNTTHGNDGYNGIRAGGSRIALLAVKDMFTELPATSGGADLQINSATLHVFRYQGSSSTTVSIYPVTTDWLPDSAGANENDVSGQHAEVSGSTTWANGDWSSSDYDSSTCNTGSWVDDYNEECSIDVTDVITAIYDSGNNYGMVLYADGAILARASENSSNRPSLEINYEYLQTTFSLTVNSGTGDGSYAESTVVDITADPAPSGQEFDRWVGDTAGIASVTSSSTTLTMPASNQEITATYTDETWTLTVNSGTGDGDYTVDTVVDIDADTAASGQFFDAWIGDTANIADLNNGSTTITMPAAAVEITATYAKVSNGLVSRYTFDVDGRDSYGTNDGTLNGGASITNDGTRGWVLSLDGVDDYVDLPAGAMTSGRSEVTLSLWMKTNEWATSDAIYDEYYTSTYNYWQFSLTNDSFFTRDTSTGSTGSRNNDMTMPSYATNTWYNLAVVYSVTDELKAIYLDGVLQQSTNLSIDTLTTDRTVARIGCPADGTYFDGLIDDVRLYSRPLSLTELAILAKRTLYTLTVNSGTGDGDYCKDQVVDIAADTAPAGMVFDDWAGDTAGIDNINAPQTTITMPAANVELTASYVNILFSLTVNSGTGDGNYTADTVVDIDADTAPSGQDFDQWIGDTSGIAAVSSSSTTLTMPAASQEITASYTDKTWTLTVNSGTGDGSYVVGAIVDIDADTAPSGQDFDQWVGDTSGIASPTSASTTLTMPYANTEITASYTDKLWTLTVNSGSGDGSYAVDTVVDINADAPSSGKQFDQWVGDTADIASLTSSSTTLTMPYGNAEITATYEDAETGTTQLIVDWGDSQANNVYDFSDWDNVYLGPYTSYSSAGPDGVVGATTNNYGTCGVNGTSESFSEGDQIVVTWYNNTGSSVTFRPEISFDDEDYPNGGSSSGTWYDMNQISLDDAETGTTGYTFTSSTAGNYSRVHVCRSENNEAQLMFDKIQLVTEGGGGGLTTYTLTVNSGTGDGSYAASTVVDIDADTASSGYVFDDWTGDTSGIANVNASSTTITMPTANTEITASYNAATLYTLTVNSGTGDGSYQDSYVVSISADSPASGKQFDQWVGDTSGIASVGAASTTLTMPASNTEITATYEDIPAGSGPSISSVSDTTPTHGQSITITGSNFGSKTTAAPYKYDDFEGGTLGARVGNGWYTSSNLSDGWPIYSDAHARASGIAEETAYLQHDRAYNSTIGVTGLNWDYGQEAYLSCWYYCTTAGAQSRNFKILAFRGGGAGNWDGPDFRADMYPNQPGGHAYVARPDKSLIVQDWGLGGHLLEDGWHRVELFMHTGTSNNSDNDGVCLGWRDLNEWWTLENFEFDFSTQNYDNIYFAAYFARDDGTPTPQMWWYWDEIYIDTTRARVEIGNASTWSACTHREIQIPSAWSGSSITVTVNQGSFADSSGAYLYVVDSDGNVNSNGYSITFAD